MTGPAACLSVYEFPKTRSRHKVGDGNESQLPLDRSRLGSRLYETDNCLTMDNL